MHFTNLLKIALRAIAANKLRAFLTMLGIIIGVASVITMIAIGEGSKASIQSNISQMGSNMIYINPGADRGPGGARQEASAMQTLKIKDYELLANEAKMVKAISPMVQSGGQFIYGNNNTPSTLYGVSVGYLDVRQLQVEEGEMFDDEDVRLSAKVCVIGRTVANELFPGGEDPVGKVVRFKSIPFRIVGVLKSKGYNTFGMDQDNLVLAPYSTVMKRILAVTHLSNITASALTETYTDEAIEEITTLLRRSHKLRAGIDEDNFTIRSQKEMMEMMNSTANVMTTLLLCVACISLIVGGIGIMNIMFVSVTERTKEIGLRMSVGARGIDILSQFLIEAVLMSITGGIIGVLFGMLITYGITTFAQWPVQIQPWSVMLSFAVCTFTGIFFGWYPAKKAANLDPIEAIRYE
ncbi:MAG: ABC transporter permease [Bacteroidaceae bacterium]|nr:ABC transporter permease [Bacteroidaceae bacterium]